MQKFRLYKVVVSGLFGLFVVLSIGPGHSLLGNEAMPSNMHAKDAAARCQVLCPPSLNERQKLPQNQQDNTDPDPFPGKSLFSYQLVVSSLYMLAVATIYVLLLQRKPPDRLALYALRRN